MKMIRDEKGYALLIVLVLVVFIMAVTAVFMRGSISNAKQEKKVDENHLSVVAAEMGVDYYTTMYTNKFMEVRKKIWEENIEEFKSAVEQSNADVNNLADTYRNKIADEIIVHLLSLSESAPANSYFGKEEKFEIGWNEKEHFILIAGDVIGNYHSGKTSALEMNLKIHVPPLLLVGDSQGNGGASSSQNDFSIPPLGLREITINQVLPIIIENNIDTSNGTIQNKSNGFKIINKGKVTLGRIQSNGGQIEIKAGDDIVTENLYDNNNITIQGNKKIDLANVQSNKGTINITGMDDITLSSNLYGNQMQIDIYTNIKLTVAGNIGENKGKVQLSAGDDISVGQFKDNKEGIQIVTLGKFTSGAIEGTQKELTIQSNYDFASGQLKGNNNVTIESSKKFTAASIHETKGYLKIKAKDDIKADIVQDNNNVFMQSDKKVTLQRIYGNKGIEILSQDDFHAKEVIQDNKDLIVKTNGKFTASTNIYGNDGITIYSKDDFSSGNIQNNNRLKIVTLRKFWASDLRLGENSIVCVGGDYNVPGEVKIPASSHVYVKGKINKNRGEEKISSSEWEQKCGVTVGNDMDGIDVIGSWKTPDIEVDY